MNTRVTLARPRLPKILERCFLRNSCGDAFDTMPVRVPPSPTPRKLSLPRPPRLSQPPRRSQPLPPRRLRRPALLPRVRRPLAPPKVRQLPVEPPKVQPPQVALLRVRRLPEAQKVRRQPARQPRAVRPLREAVVVPQPQEAVVRRQPEEEPAVERLQAVAERQEAEPHPGTRPRLDTRPWLIPVAPLPEVATAR